jgi:uncharacterized protein (TIGR02001 family)
MAIVRVVSSFILAVTASMSAAPAAAGPLSGEVGIVTDYRYRGLSLSDGNPALQASLTFEHSSGLYVTAWASTLRRIGNPSDSEVDFTAGYEREIDNWASFDLSMTRYSYPSSGGANYSEATASVTLTHGAASAILGFSYAPPQSALRDDAGRRRGNGYTSLQTAYEVGGTPLTLRAGLGYERGAFDEVERGGKWDWNVGGEATRGPFKFSLTYVGCNADVDSRNAVVGALSFSW